MWNEIYTEIHSLENCPKHQNLLKKLIKITFKSNNLYLDWLLPYVSNHWLLQQLHIGPRMWDWSRISVMTATASPHDSRLQDHLPSPASVCIEIFADSAVRGWLRQWSRSVEMMTVPGHSCGKRPSERPIQCYLKRNAQYII